MYQWYNRFNTNIDIGYNIDSISANLPLLSRMWRYFHVISLRTVCGWHIIMSLLRIVTFFTDNLTRLIVWTVSTDGKEHHTSLQLKFQRGTVTDQQQSCRNENKCYTRTQCRRPKLTYILHTYKYVATATRKVLRILLRPNGLARKSVCVCSGAVNKRIILRIHRTQNSVSK